MIVKLLTEHHLEFLSFKGACTGLSESKLVKMPHCWKSHVAAQLLYCIAVKSGACNVCYRTTEPVSWVPDSLFQ